MSDLISREDAINAVAVAVLDDRDELEAIKAIPSVQVSGDLISRADAMARIANDNVVGGMERINEYNNSTEFNDYLDGISDAITTIFCDVPSADAETKWNCTANFVAEQLEKLKDMTDEERIKLLQTMFSSAEAVQVVRCKECKHYGATDCQIQESFYGIKDFDFCSYGERKGGDDE